MKLVYQTSDMNRANQIMKVLSESGIERTLQGVHSWSIRYYGFRNPLTVWVVHDEEAQRAHEVLARFYASEIPLQSTEVISPKSKISRLGWFLLSLGAVIVLALIMHGS